MTIPLLVVTVFVVAAALVVISVAGRRRSEARRNPPNLSLESRWEKHCYKRLVRRLLGDEDAAERLIEYERIRNPGASRATLVEAAIHRLEHDRGSWRV
ncbi:MAG: hypothetical protein WBC63_02110 [Candidatus Bipolaricaulia bacterium]